MSIRNTSLSWTSRDLLSRLMHALIPSSKSTTIFIPPPPSILLANDVESYKPRRPASRKHDTPIGTVYRIYWAIIMEDTVSMRNEIEYFWGRKEKSWKVHKLPQPPDPDLQRFAIISAIPFVLVAAFNRLIELGLPREANQAIYTSEQLEKLGRRSKVFETPPEWAVAAPPLDSPLHLPTKDLASPETGDEEGADPYMLLKNVLVWRLHIFFT